MMFASSREAQVVVIVLVGPVLIIALLAFLYWPKRGPSPVGSDEEPPEPSVEPPNPFGESQQ